MTPAGPNTLFNSFSLSSSLSVVCYILVAQAFLTVRIETKMMRKCVSSVFYLSKMTHHPQPLGKHLLELCLQAEMPDGCSF